jgi:hypothetical protein
MVRKTTTCAISTTRRLAAIGGAVLLGAITSIVAADGLLRVVGYHGLIEPALYRYDAQLGWSLLPNAHARTSALDYVVDIDTDADGLRDLPAGSRPQDARRTDVLVLGDSFAFGWGVAYPDIFSTQLDHLRHDRRTGEIRTAGVPGYSTDQEYLLWSRLAVRLKPRTVILLFHGSDIDGNNVPSTGMGDAIYGKPYFVDAEDGLVLRGVPVAAKRSVATPRFAESLRSAAKPLALYALGRAALDVMRRRRAAPPAAASASAGRDPQRFTLTRSLIRALDADVRRHGAHLLVVTTPLDPADALELATTCAVARIHLVDLESAFAGRRDAILPHDGHWNARGHRLAAERVLPALEAMPR